jgi:hypothetical protein
MTESGFDPGLFDPALAGVHAVAQGDLTMLGLAARDAGLRTTTIELDHCTGKPVLLLRMATALDFPPGRGRNWDALSDSLRDLGWLEAPGGHALLFADAGDLRDAAPADYGTLLSILHEAVESWAGTDTPLWAFIGLPDDELDAP